jgi:CO/xanthine dehydrogenase Mo-binding subunit
MPVPRKEGRDKVTGRAQYIDDITLPGMLYGATVRSSIPRGKIKSITFGPEIPWNELVVVSAKDIPGTNCVALISEDQPCLAESEVNHPEEPILLLAHAQRHVLSKAVAAITIEYDPLPALFSIEESEKQNLIIWGTDNVFKRFLVQKGNADTCWPDAAYIVEGEYTTGAQEQLYIENNGVIASYDQQSGITVWGSLQCPYYVHKALMRLLALPEDKVRVVQTETGGAFGGKEDYPSMIAGHAALLAVKAGKPVKIIYDRMEDMSSFAHAASHGGRSRRENSGWRDRFRH